MRSKPSLLVILYFSMQACLAVGKSPIDVNEFIQQREVCDHFRGEIPEPEDKERMEEVRAEIRKFCTGTDARLDSLKKKYAANAEIMARLVVFEVRIEQKRKTSSQVTVGSDEGGKKWSPEL